MSTETEIGAECRTCPKCGQTKTLSDFAKGGAKQARRRTCKACWAAYMRGWTSQNKDKISHQNRQYKIRNPEKYRDNRMRHLFGITAADYDQMYERQGGRCKCCGIHNYDLTRNLAVDHCHRTDEVRGLLCTNCNAALGMVDDSIDVLQAMIVYLQVAKQRQGELK